MRLLFLLFPPIKKGGIAGLATCLGTYAPWWLPASGVFSPDQTALNLAQGLGTASGKSTCMGTCKALLCRLWRPTPFFQAS